MAIEVVSPHDSFAEVESKALTWLESGSQLVLIVEPESETLHAYRSRSDISVLTSTELFDAGESVPGWQVQVSDIFS